MADPPSSDLSPLFLELGTIVIGLAVMTRIAHRFGMSSIPLFLLTGLAFGTGGLMPIPLSGNFVHVVAEVGVLLLLFMLGLEYSGKKLKENLNTGLPAGLMDFALNFTPGFVLGLFLHWTPLTAVVLGGVTWVSSSGVSARILGELKRMENKETPAILSILVLEDLAMAVYLPIIGVLLIGQGWMAGAISVSIALVTVGLVLFVAIRFGDIVSRVISHKSDEVVLFTLLGLMLLVAGLAQRLQVSAAIGAFLVGIAVSGPMAGQAHRQLSPIRDLFAAIFFLFFGLQINPSSLPPVLPLAVGLALVTTATKVFTGWWAARRAGVEPLGSLHAGATLVARGEFSIVIAGLGVSAGLNAQLGALSAAYVLLTVLLGPLLARTIGPLGEKLMKRKLA